MRILILALALAGLSGCASAGPVVTNVSYDGKGAINVEKCTIYVWFFWGTAGLDKCFVQKQAVVLPAPRLAPARKRETILAPPDLPDPYEPVPPPEP